MLNIEKLLNNKDIDGHVEELINKILILKTELDTLNDWYRKEWLKLANKNINTYSKKYESNTNKWKIWDYWIYEYILEPKKFQCCVYIRAFLDKLYIYLKTDHRDHIKNKKMWESSQYLKYYVHLIFKTRFYEKKIFIDEEILEELKKLISFLSDPLHAHSIYFNKVYLEKNKINNIDKVNKIMQKKIANIVNLILRRGINNDVIKKPIIESFEIGKQEYLNWTTYKIFDDHQIKNFLSFFKNNCLKEFEKEIKNSMKWKAYFKKIKVNI